MTGGEVNPSGEPDSTSFSSSAITRVSPIVSHHDHPEAIRQLAKQQMIRKTPQVRPAQSMVRKMKPLRLRGDQVNQTHQLRPELIPQPWRNPVVMPQDFADIALNKRMVSETHRPRSSRTRRTNSSCSIGSTLPASISASRRNTSSSVTSASGAASVRISDKTNSARSLSLNPKASCSIS